VGGRDDDDIIVTIEHPFGLIEVPIAQWISTGPGPRPLVRPVAARSRSTGIPLPLSVIPLRYRNSSLSRMLIALRLTPDPWKATDE
jgi:hypothetical protein